MNSFIKIFLRFFLLIALALFFELIFNKITEHLFYNLIENILFAIVLICPLCFFKNKLKVYYLIISYLFFAICIYFETIFYYLFNASFSASAIFVMLDSNIQESKEFLSFYIDLPILFFTIFIIVLAVKGLFTFNKFQIKNQHNTKTHKLKVLGLFFSILVFLKLSALIVFNVPYLVLKSSFEYYKESKLLSNYKDNKTGDFTNVSRISKQEKEIYVIIIGESTSRSHMGIYNYYRETTPNLKKIKDELIIYKNVISPHTYTIASLSKSLTMGNYEDPENKYKGSILQLANQTNFKTYWISNQRPLGVFDSQVTKIGLGAHKSVFLNIEHTNEKTKFDEVLLEQLDKVFLEEGDKKLIFLHMIGVHINYKNRFPESFNFFKNIPKTVYNKKEVYSSINSYDNALRYSDFVISKIIESVRELDKNSFVLYFSDHGEEVYDEIDFLGHSADQVITKNIYEIPFFIWQSERFRKESNILIEENRKYMIDDLFHSIADLINVKADEVDNTRSIFNENFKERKRIIRDTIDYDTYFNKATE